MSNINITLPAIVLLSTIAGAFVWFAKTAWRIDRRLVRIETKLGLIDERTI